MPGVKVSFFAQKTDVFEVTKTCDRIGFSLDEVSRDRGIENQPKESNGDVNGMNTDEERHREMQRERERKR